MGGVRVSGASRIGSGRSALWWAQGLLLAGNSYLLGLAIAARLRRRQPPQGQLLTTFLVFVPAYNEALGIGPTLDALIAARYPSDRVEVCVVADNCTDSTAGVARSMGVQVLERHDLDAVGKGHALAWAAKRKDLTGIDAVVVVDADCVVSSNVFEVMDGFFGSGEDAVQVSYKVSNADASPAAALRFGGFALMSHVRPAGKDALGLSAGLSGTGMAFRASVLRKVPWEAFSLTEDIEYHLHLIDKGFRVRFAPDAYVTSAMPETFQEAESQEERWEGGRVALLRNGAIGAIAAGMRRGSVTQILAGLELFIPPQSLLLSLNAVDAAVSLRGRFSCRWLLGVSAIVTQVAYIGIGLGVVGRGDLVLRALPYVPWLVARKLRLYLHLVRGRGDREWRRTMRVGEAGAELPSTGAI